jgi:hypothetical protein
MGAPDIGAPIENITALSTDTAPNRAARRATKRKRMIRNIVVRAGIPRT